MSIDISQHNDQLSHRSALQACLQHLHSYSLQLEGFYPLDDNVVILHSYLLSQLGSGIHSQDWFPC